MDNVRRKIDLLDDAFARHTKQRHNADFEVCLNSVCKFMCGIEKQLYEAEIFPFVKGW
jgi:hypothetical protein